jgi:hypothetical protein
MSSSVDSFLLVTQTPIRDHLTKIAAVWRGAECGADRLILSIRASLGYVLLPQLANLMSFLETQLEQAPMTTSSTLDRFHLHVYAFRSASHQRR